MAGSGFVAPCNRTGIRKTPFTKNNREAARPAPGRAKRRPSRGQQRGPQAARHPTPGPPPQNAQKRRPCAARGRRPEGKSGARGKAPQGDQPRKPGAVGISTFSTAPKRATPAEGPPQGRGGPGHPAPAGATQPKRQHQRAAALWAAPAFPRARQAQKGGKIAA